MKQLNKIFNKIGWTGLIIILMFIGIYTYAILKKKDRIENAVFVKGVSLGIQSGVRGHLYLYYSFIVKNQNYNGNVTDDFCNECSTCCHAGGSVIVRFQKDDPENNDLVSRLPTGSVLEIDP